MKIIVISDSHNNIANLKHVMGFGKKIGAKAVIHCGDWNDKKSIETVLSFRLPLYTVLGNADIHPDEENALISGAEGFDSKFLGFRLGGKKIGVTHSLRNLMPIVKSFDVVFSGHSHRQKVEEKGGTKIVNPGALENDVNFAVFNTNSGKIELINEKR